MKRQSLIPLVSYLSLPTPLCGGKPTSRGRFQLFTSTHRRCLTIWSFISIGLSFSHISAQQKSDSAAVHYPIAIFGAVDGGERFGNEGYFHLFLSDVVVSQKLDAYSFTTQEAASHLRMMPIVCANIWLGSASIGMSLLAHEREAEAMGGKLDDELR